MDEPTVGCRCEPPERFAARRRHILPSIRFLLMLLVVASLTWDIFSDPPMWVSIVNLTVAGSMILLPHRVTRRLWGE